MRKLMATALHWNGRDTSTGPERDALLKSTLWLPTAYGMGSVRAPPCRLLALRPALTAATGLDAVRFACCMRVVLCRPRT